jgi:hypothetical protein
LGSRREAGDELRDCGVASLRKGSTDQGVGMDVESLKNAIKPFYTM